MSLSLSSINLNELINPHQLSRFFLQLPTLKEDCNKDDKQVCQSLASFVYQEQICGKFLMNNFNKQDFDNMMEVITMIFDTKLETYDHNWIWQIIHKLQNNNKNNLNSSKITKVSWINSVWNQFQTLYDTDNKEQHNTNNCEKDEKQWEHNSDSGCFARKVHRVSLSKCKPLKNIMASIHFYQALNSEIKDDPKYLVEHFKSDQGKTIYNDFKHLMLTHNLKESESNDDNHYDLKKISKFMNNHIECDIVKCQSYQNRNDKPIKNCIDLIKRDKLNDNNISQFCVELMDIIHCAFMHQEILIDSP